MNQKFFHSLIVALVAQMFSKKTALATASGIDENDLDTQIRDLEDALTTAAQNATATTTVKVLDLFTSTTVTKAKAQAAIDNFINAATASSAELTSLVNEMRPLVFPNQDAYLSFVNQAKTDANATSTTNIDYPAFVTSVNKTKPFYTTGRGVEVPYSLALTEKEPPVINSTANLNSISITFGKIADGTTNLPANATAKVLILNVTVIENGEIVNKTVNVDPTNFVRTMLTPIRNAAATNQVNAKAIEQLNQIANACGNLTTARNSTDAIFAAMNSLIVSGVIETKINLECFVNISTRETTDQHTWTLNVENPAENANSIGSNVAKTISDQLKAFARTANVEVPQKVFIYHNPFKAEGGKTIAGVAVNVPSLNDVTQFRKQAEVLSTIKLEQLSITTQSTAEQDRREKLINTIVEKLNALNTSPMNADQKANMLNVLYNPQKDEQIAELIRSLVVS